MATFKNTAIAAVIIALTTSANAGNIGGGPHGGMSTGAASPGMMGMGSSSSSSAGAPSQGSQGGRYTASMVDGYQPWPEAEMRRFEKPRWEPFAGDGANAR